MDSNNETVEEIHKNDYDLRSMVYPTSTSDSSTLAPKNKTTTTSKTGTQGKKNPTLDALSIDYNTIQDKENTKGNISMYEILKQTQ